MKTIRITVCFDECGNQFPAPVKVVDEKGKEIYNGCWHEMAWKVKTQSKNAKAYIYFDGEWHEAQATKFGKVLEE